MRINKVDYKTSPQFGDNILTKENENLVRMLREELDTIKTQGIPLGDCFCKVPEETNITLETKDKKYSTGYSMWGENLIIRETNRKDNGRYVISKDNDIFWSDEDDVKELKHESKEALTANLFLAQTIPLFLNIKRFRFSNLFTKYISKIKI